MARWGWVAAVALGALLLSAHRSHTEAVVALADDAYTIEVIASNRTGLAAADGLRWSRGGLYIADEGGSALRLWRPSRGVETLSLGSGMVSPEDIEVDGQGNLYFTDDAAGGLWIRDARGRVRQLAGREDGLASTEGLALAPDGSIVVGDGEKHAVWRVTREGQVSVLLGPEAGIRKPESLAFDEEGSLYIADDEAGVVYKLRPDRRLRVLLDKGSGIEAPETLCYRQGVLYITDNDAGRLLRYTPREGVRGIADFGGKLKNVQGIAVDDRGAIYVSVQVERKHPRTGYLLRLIERLPDDVSMEDTIYELYFRQRVDRGLRELDAGDTIPMSRLSGASLNGCSPLDGRRER